MGAGPLDFPIAFRGGDAATYGITLNNHRTAAGAFTPAAAKDAFVVERFDFSRLEFRDQRDGLHLLLGGDLGVVSSEFRFVSIAGYIEGSTAAALEDRVGKLLAAFHPENCVAASPTTRGVMELDFYTPSSESLSGYTSPFREMLKGRPTGIPVVYERRASGLVMLFALELICPDTRRYIYTAESKACNAGNSWTIAVPNWTAKQGAATTGIITLALTGTGSSDCTLRYVDTMTGLTTNLVLNLSGLSASSHTITVDVGNGLIKEGSTHLASLRTSAVDTAIWAINGAGGTFSVPTGRTALTSATLAYRQARA